MVCFSAGKTREVDTFVTKPLISPGAGQAHLEYSYRKTVRGILSSRSLPEDLVPARHIPNVGNHYRHTCWIWHLLLTFMLSILVIFQLVAERDLRTRVRCSARVRHVRKIRNACEHTGAREKGLHPRRKMCTAGPSNPVIKEARAREFVRTTSMS